MIGLAENNGHAEMDTSEVRAVGLLKETSVMRGIFADGRAPLLQALPNQIVCAHPFIGFLVPVSALTPVQLHKAAELCATLPGANDLATCIADLRRQRVFPIHVSHFGVVLALTLAPAPAAAAAPAASAEGGL